MTTTWYRMSDLPDAESRAAIEVTREDAPRWNTPEHGFGIFMTVNSFNGPRRKDCLTQINAWAIDIDQGGKPAMHDRLQSSPLVPSMIVETKRGYQAYWIARQPAHARHWNAIVLERLVPHFGADKNARDLCRILRVPGFLHLKDPHDPFRVRVCWKYGVAYTERQMAEAFGWVPNRQAHDEARREAERELRAKKEQAQRESAAAGTEIAQSFWDAVWELDCEEGLRRLSGHWAVGCEQYKFVRAGGRGHLNIFVNGKSSSCFIDEAKKIGSLSGGGPTLAQWLRWFRHDWKTVVTVLKELFPQLVEIDEAAQKARHKA